MDKQQAFNNVVAGLKRHAGFSMDEGVTLAQALGVIQMELGLVPAEPQGPPLAVTQPNRHARRAAAKAANGADAEPETKAE